MTALLRPSAAHRWGNCAGSYVMEQAYPEDDGEEARLGTAAHYYVTEALEGRVWPVGHITPNGVPIDDEMIECGAAFIAYGQTLGVPRWVERRVTMHTSIHPLCEGTPDLYHVDHTQHRLVVADYKYGHRYVDPYRNEQLCAYVAGVCEAEGISRDAFKGWSVELVVIQPRNYHASGPVRTWRAVGIVVWQVIDYLRESAGWATSGDADTETGDHCRDCSARHACPAFLQANDTCIDVAGQAIPHELPADALGLKLRQIRTAITRLEALETGLSAVAMAMLQRGDRVPGWSVQQGMGRETWACSVDQVKSLGDVMGVTLVKQAPITPNQARAAGLDPDLVKQFSTVPKRGWALTPVTSDTAAKAFG